VVLRPGGDLPLPSASPDLWVLTCGGDSELEISLPPSSLSSWRFRSLRRPSAAKLPPSLSVCRLIPCSVTSSSEVKLPNGARFRPRRWHRPSPALWRGGAGAAGRRRRPEEGGGLCSTTSPPPIHYIRL
jgi:hypothetical protein